MVKLVALFKKPDNPAEFNSHFSKEHISLLKKLPGLRRLEISKITGSVVGELSHHVSYELYFDSADEMDSALSSPQGRVMSKDLIEFAAKNVTLFTAEVESDVKTRIFTD